MSSWQEIEDELHNRIQSDEGALDSIRRERLSRLSDVTGRPVVMYAVEMFNVAKVNLTRGDTSINLSDRDGLIEALNGLEGEELDFVIHSPGGSPEATESLVKLIRSKFRSVRFIVPSIAKSAATMLAMSGDEIILGENAELGPTDPQIVINGAANPAHAIIEQFELAKSQIGKTSSVLPAWLPILQQYGPSLLVVCDKAIQLTTSLVKEWLASYMFKDEPRAKMKAVTVSKFLSGNKHLSHSRIIDIPKLQQKGVKIKYASEISADFAAAIRDLHIATMQTFGNSGAYKIFENSNGKGFYRTLQITQPISPPPSSQSI